VDEPQSPVLMRPVRAAPGPLRASDADRKRGFIENKLVARAAIIARVRAAGPLGHVILADARHPLDGQSNRPVRKTRRRFENRPTPRSKERKLATDFPERELALFKADESISREREREREREKVHRSFEVFPKYRDSVIL